MPDPITAATSAAAAAAKSETGKSLIKAVLIPPADVLGRHMAEILDGRLGQWRADNAQRILEKAARKTADIEEMGHYPPKVIRSVFDDGSLDDSELIAEYLGGVLASSKSPSGRDDRGVGLSTLINRLSSYTLRMHYIFYSALRSVAKGSGVNLRVERNRRNLRTYIPWSSYTEAMDFETPEEETTATEHAIIAMERDGLMSRYFLMGSAENLRKEAKREIPDEGLVFEPSMPGVELYLWGHGYGRADYDAFLDPNEEFEFEVDLDIPAGSALLTTFPEISAGTFLH
jgi:hypothetical protein